MATLNHAGAAGDVTCLSMASGAFLEGLEGKPLPGVNASGEAMFFRLCCARDRRENTPMAENVQDATLEILKGIQASISDLRRDMNDRFEALSTDARKDRRNINGIMALLQAASGDFDGRIRDVDERVSILEDRAS